MTQIKRFILSALLLTVLFQLNSQAQTCAHTDRNSWTWPGHNNWFLPKWAPNDGISNIYNQATGVTSSVIQTNYNWNFNRQATSIRGYQGIAAASNDNGDLIFFTNGRKAWKADGTLISDQILQGNECGSVGDRGSAVHGCMIVRHPLQPLYYYILTIDDIVNQGCANNGITVAIIDSSGNLVQNSMPIEQNITGGLQGKFRTTESMAATMHGNGVDVWVTFQPLEQYHYVTYLLTCDGFTTPAVVSAEGMCAKTHIALGNGDMDFSQDGTKFAGGVHVNQGDIVRAPLLGHETINLYDFDNMTANITNRKAIFPLPGSTNIVYNLLFSADASTLHYGGQSGNGMFPTTGTEAAIRAAHSASTSLTGGWEGAAMNAGGQIEDRKQTNVKAGVSGPQEFGANDMFIPPLEEPDIAEVGPFCDTTSTVDLATIWMCSGVNSELAIKANETTFGYKGPGIGLGDSARVKGLFNPSAAGVGTHEIIFVYCGVNDTIWIEVISCASCIDTLVNIAPELCAGPGGTLNLATLVDTANAKGYWTIKTIPGTATNDAFIDSSTTDTLFSAVDLATKYGVYEMMYTVTKDGIECKDSINIIVNKPPVVTVNDSLICAGDPSALFTATTDSVVTTHLWGDNGSGSAQTTTGTVAGIYTVLVTDNNGCTGRDTGLLSINALPIVTVNDSTICSDGGPALFTATSDTAAANYIWGSLATGTNATTTGTVAGLYSVLLIDVNGCIGLDTGEMFINVVPVVTVNDSTICFGDPDALFTATSDSAAGVYLWSENGFGNQQTTTGSTAGNYTVTVTDNNGCIGSGTGVLTVNALPEVTVNDSTICAGGLVSATFTATSDSAAAVYLWSENGTGGAQTTSGTTPGNYTVTVTDNNGCINSGTGILKLSALPDVSVNDAEICIGDPGAVFSVTSDTAAVSYQWSGNGTGTDPTSTGTVAGDYTVVIVDANGCPGTAKGVLTVHALPVVTLQGGNVCPATPFTLTPIVTTLNDPPTYSWDTGESSPTVQKGAGTYTVTVTDGKGCVNTASATIIEDPNLTPIIPGPISLCQGEDTVLISNYKAADGYSFVWTNGATPTGDVTESITVSASGTYGLGVSKGACVGATTVTVTVNALPTVTVAIPAICDGDPASTATATSATATGYTWSENGTGSSPTTSGTTAGNYTVIITDINNCADTATGVLVVNALPTVTVNDEPICIGDPVATFTATSPTATGWTWSENGSGGNQTTTGTTAGNYTVVVSDVNGCEETSTGVLTVNSLPSVTVAPNTLCADGPTPTFTAVSATAVAWLWSENGTGTDPTTQGRDAGNFTVQVTDVNGCISSGIGVLDLQPLPVLDNDPGAMCAGDPVSIGQPAQGAGTFVYTWLGAVAGETTASITVSAAGLYNRQVTNSVTGCVASSQHVVTVNALPELNVEDQTVCDGVAMTLSDTYSATGYNYIWNPGTITTATVNPTSTQDYTITKYDDITGCSSPTVTASAVFVAIPNANITPDTVTVCQDMQANLFVDHDASSLLWSTGETTDYITTLFEGEYSVIASNGGCPATDTVYVQLVQYPVSTIDHSLAIEPICFEEQELATVLTGNTDQSLNYLWSTGDVANTIEVTEEGTYSVAISRDAAPGEVCEITDQIFLRDFCPYTFYIPNAFTPNDAGPNEIFYAYGTHIVEFEITVYDRWGLKVFESNNINIGWNGRYMGKTVQNDVYVWKVKYTVDAYDGSTQENSRVGHVTVIK